MKSCVLIVVTRDRDTGANRFGVEQHPVTCQQLTETGRLERLRKRCLSRMRVMAERESKIGFEGLQRFVAKQVLPTVDECVLGVLASESEPVDPGLSVA